MILMVDYIESLKDAEKVRKADDELTRLMMKEYRKMTRKLSLLANSARPDLSYTALQMSKRNNLATISDLRGVNRVIKKVRERESRIKLRKSL